jgi:sec-independent protein translocase protein TatB
MFDIGFWEMVLIAVVALVVVGPKELPGLIRNVGVWVAQARKVAGEFKEEFSREVARAEEIKRLVERETEIAELHKALEEARANISLDGGAEAGKPRDGATEADDAPRVGHGGTPSGGRREDGER